MKTPLTMKAAAPAPTATAEEAGLSDLTPEQRALLMLRLRRKAAETEEEGLPAIPRAPREGDLPLSFSQERLWFLDRLEPGNPAYNIPAAVRIWGALDVAAFGRAVTEMVRRHEVLRTTFPEAGGEPRQEIAPPPAALPLPQIDLSGLPAERRDPAARELALQAARQPFDLGRDTLVRVLLLRLDAEVHVALVNLHHIAADGWSVSIVIREIAGAYAAFAAGRAPELPELPIQYADFAVWQRGFLSGPELERQLAFWRQTLAGAPPVLELPADRPRPPFQTFRGGRREVYLPPALWSEVRAASQRSSATSFMTALATFKALLVRLTGQEDVLVGSPIANRNRHEIEGLIGFFVNTLVLRTDLSAAPSLREAVLRVREGTLAAYAHQDLPFAEVVKELGDRDLSRNPLFQVMFSLNNVPQSELAMEGLALVLEDGSGDTAKFDFDLMTLEHGGTLTGSVEYNADLFDPTSVDRFLAQWRSLLAAAVAEPDRPLVELPLLTAAERQQLIEEWSHGETVPRLSGTLHGLFAAQAARTPAATAVIAGTERLSYGELAGRVRRLAGRLSQLGMGPERIVGVRLERTAELVVTLLAVLESGAAYLPLDPAYPAERLRFLLADAGAALVVTERSLPWPEGFTAEIPELSIDEATLEETAAPAAAPVSALVSGTAAEEALAYLIYTSGSTGVPKGVAIPHGSALRLVEWALARYSAAELAGVLFSTSTSFDLSIFELFVPLSSGGAVIMADNALALPGLPAAPEVTLVNTVPSALAGLLDLGPLPAAVRTVNLAGEPLRGALAERIHGAGVARLWNLYGPSEDTTYSTGTEVAPGTPGTPETHREPDIGRPVAGSTAFVLDGSLGMLPVGVPGELCLGGEALARGYFNRPALTAERFVPDPFGDFGGLGGSRLYRTGDRARWRSDGALELLGRMDQQVKVRGFRIELGEIEAVLSGHPAVREAAVTAPADASGDRRLVAYVSATDGGGPLDVAALGVYLGSRLPSFMVPALWVELEALPRTRTGKVDRQALRAPGETAAGAAYEAPRTATEEMLAGIWGDLLGRERVGVHDNFFALGGHSLLATQVVSRLRARLGVELPVRALFEQPTVAGLAVLLAGFGKGGDEGVAQAPPIVALPRDAEGGGTFPASFAQRRLWFLDQLEPESAVYNMPLALSLEGELAEEPLAAVFGELARRHETLRTTFIAGADGPLQVVHPIHPMPPMSARPFALASIDLSAMGEEERRRELTRLVAEDSLRPFDLAGGPLLRATLVRLAARENALLLNMHHVISDGWSMGVLVREVTALYAAAVAGRPLGEVLPPLPVQYADFSVWQSRWLSGETLQREIEHWREKLAGVPPFLELPTDRPRPPVKTVGGRSLPLWLEPGLAGRLSALALETGTTLFMVLLAGFEMLLGIYSGAQDLAVGTPIAARNRAELEGLIGFFVNSLVLRGDLSGDPSFVDLLGRVREDTLSAYTHQDLPFEKLVEEINPERSQAHSPIFQAMFALQNAPMGEGSELPGLTMRPVAGSETPAKFDLALWVAEGDGGIGGSLEYNVDLFDAPTMVRLLDHWRALLGGVVANPGSRLSALPLLGPAERQQLLREWSDAAPVAGVAAPVHELFAVQAAQRPDAVALVAALVSGHQVLTYGELARRSSRMARRLVELGVGPGMLVGLCAERSPELILGVLAILAAGGAYLPLDPAHPVERLAYTLADAGAPLLLAEESLGERLPAGAARVVGLHELVDLVGGEEGMSRKSGPTSRESSPPGPLSHLPTTHSPGEGEIGLGGVAFLPLSRRGEGGRWERGPGGEDSMRATLGVPSEPGDLAYVIYTSGSTGRPKGVEVSHANVARLFAVIRQNVPFGSDDVWTLFHSIAFDFSVWELWGALAFGGRLVLVPSETARSAEAFYDLLRRERVTVLSQTPSAFRQLLWAEESALARDEEMVSDLRLVVFGGEALDPLSLAPWLERHGDERPLLVNLYGITETTVHTTWRRLRQSDLSRPGSRVGRPLSDLALYLLDGVGRPVPIGAPGEIHVGGAGVARGYRARPALTAERFVPDPFAGAAQGEVGGLRLYRSGDLARWRRDGDLEYLGRIDRQVKVRGFRIELGEIEAALAEHPAVREAVVVAREDRPGDVRLVGYVSSAARPEPSPQALADFLAERLPAYMVPAAWVLLDRLPLTANGKVDRAALPAPSGKVDRAALPAPSGKMDRAALPAPSERGEGGAYVAPRSPVEQVLAGIWEEVLGLQRVGMEDDFFALGGHSLIANQVTSRVLTAFSVDLSLRVLFERPTVAAMAAEVERLRGSGAATAAAAAPPLVRTPRGTEAPMSFRQEWRWLFDQLSPSNTGNNVPLALTLRGAVSAPALAAALAAEVERHESLRTRFVLVGGKPVQRIDPPWRPPLQFVDLGGLPPAAAEREAARLAALEWIFPFDLARGPLLRSVLLRLEEERFVFLLTLHHIISDGWSMRVLARELPALYEAAQAGLPSPLPELPLQFRDFAIWQRGWLQGEALEHLLGAAVTRLAGMPSLDLPLDRPPSVQRYSSAGTLPFGLDVALTASLRALSRRQGASLFMTVLAAFTGLLRRHTGRGDFPVASITAGRTRAELEPLIGYFTNTLVIRAAAGGDPDFGELLARTRGATLAAYDHQDLPFSHLVEALRAERSGEPPLFEVLFLLQPPTSEVAVPDAEIGSFPVEATQGGDFALVLDLFEVGGGLIGTFRYNQGLFDSTTALRWRGHLEALLAGAAADPTQPLTELPLLSEGERHQVTIEWGGAVRFDGRPAPIGIWGELVGEPAGRPGRFLADGTVQTSLPAPAGSAEPKADSEPAAPETSAPKASGEPARSLESLSAAKRKLLARRIRGEAGADAAAPAPRRQSGGAYLAPRSPVEQVLAGIWEEVLGRERVGVEDDFFALGGHSLLAIQVTSRVLMAFDVDLPLRVLFDHPTVAALAAEVERRRGSDAATAASAAPPLVRAPRGTEAPMSFRQEWRWLSDQLSPVNTGNNMPFALTLRGAVSAPALAAALAAEVERHESLRTRFVSAGGKPVQRIDPPGRPPLPFVDLGGLPPAVAEHEAARLAAAEWTFPFDLARGPLLRSVLLRLEDEVFVLLLTLHHIISDGWSIRILARELSALYEAAQAGLPSPLPELPIQFRDFAIWQRGWLQGETLKRLLGDAVTRLAGMPSLDLPTDRPPSAQPYFSSGVLPFGLDVDLTASLSALSRGQEASLFMTVLAAFMGLLRRHTGRGDFPVTSITAGRTRAEIEPLIGYFTNTLVIRAAAGDDPGFGELLARTRGATLAAYDHQDLPFTLLVEALRAERSGELPVFEVLFNLLPPRQEAAAAPGVEVGQFPVEATQGQDFALVLDLVEAGGRLIGTLSYNQGLFDSTTALRWRGHLEALLAGAAADPTRPLTELPLLSEGERHQVTVEWEAAVRLDGGPAPIGIWGELAGAPAGRPGRFRADGTVETSAPAAAGPAEPKAAPAPSAAAVTASGEPGEPTRSLESLSSAKRKLLAKRIRGEAGAALPGARREPSLLVDLRPERPATDEAAVAAAAAERPPFFCVHAIGGAVLSYRDLALRLGEEQPFYGIQAAGLAGGHAVDDLPAMATQYAAAVEAVAPHGPYLLGGWSFGGIVAFEMARQMRQRGRPVALVALLDSWAPALVPMPEPAREDDLVRLYLLDQAGLQGLDASWLDGEPPGMDEAAALDWLLARAHETGLLRASVRLAQVRPLLDVYRANVRASAAYRPRPGSGRLTLFRPHASPEPTNGWSALADEPVEVHEMAADHYSMLVPPAVADLADRLRSCIERSLDAVQRAAADGPPVALVP